MNHFLVQFIVFFLLLQVRFASSINPGELIEVSGSVQYELGEYWINTDEGIWFLLIGELKKGGYSLKHSVDEQNITGYYGMAFDRIQKSVLHVLVCGKSKSSHNMAVGLSQWHPVDYDEYSCHSSGLRLTGTACVKKSWKDYIRKLENSSLVQSFGSSADPDFDILAQDRLLRWNIVVQNLDWYWGNRSLFNALHKREFSRYQSKSVSKFGIRIIKKDYLLLLEDMQTGDSELIFPIAYGSNPDGGDKQEEGDMRTPETPKKLRTWAKTPFSISRRFKGTAQLGMIGATLGVQSSLKKHKFWSKNGMNIAIHGTPNFLLLGTKASHGCIRMSENDINLLYDLTKAGTPVIIQ
jgi:hypothetical protein